MGKQNTVTCAGFIKRERAYAHLIGLQAKLNGRPNRIEPFGVPRLASLSELRLLQDFFKKTHIDAFAGVDRPLQRAQ